MKPEAFDKSEAAAIETGQTVAARRRREQNAMRGGMWTFSSLPWEPRRSLTHVEWDVLWRLAFGGMSDEMRLRIDRPEHGHTHSEAREWRESSRQPSLSLIHI